MADLLFTTDLQNATKAELKALVKRVRQEFGKTIDLRTADVTALRQYLQDYLTAQTEATNCEPDDDVIGGQAATVTDAIFAEPEVRRASVKDVAPDVSELPATIEEIATVNVIPAHLPAQTMTEAKSDVTTWITLLYAGTPDLPAGRVADINLVTQLFPAFNGDWEGLRSQIAFRVQFDSDDLVEGEFYGVERLDRKELYADILPNLAWLRQVEDDEVFILRNLSEFEGIDDLSMGDWWVSSPLSCDVCNYQYCYIPEQKPARTRLNVHFADFPANPTAEDLKMLAELQRFHSVTI